MPVIQTPGSGRAGLDGSFNEPSIHLSLNEKLSEGHQCPFAKRRFFGIDTIQNELPPPIHHCGLNHLIIGDTGVRFQDERQGEHRWGHWRPPSLFLSIQIRQLLLECCIKQDMPVLAQEHKQFGLPYPFHNLFLLYRKRYWRLPG
jgi:hypothetical protein